MKMGGFSQNMGKRRFKKIVLFKDKDTLKVINLSNVALTKLHVEVLRLGLSFFAVFFGS